MKPPTLNAAQRLEWLRLIRSNRIGPGTFRRLINRYGGAQAALAALPELLAKKHHRHTLLCSREQAETEINNAARAGLTMVALGDADYPPLLANIDAPPPLLWVAGKSIMLKRPMLAVVGSRNASAIGAKFTSQLCRELGEQGWLIVSGLARGIDSHAHHAALNSGTCAFMAGGTNMIYPRENTPLYENIINRGIVASEMPPGYQAKSHDFPRRNRLIAGCAYAVIVVEAAKRSGTLVTARYGAEYGRDVFAVPGSPLDPRAEGTNALIRDGATLLTSAQDVFDDLAGRLDLQSWSDSPPPLDAETEASTPAQEQPQTILNSNSHLAESDSDIIAQVMNLLGPTPVEVDAVIRATGQTAAVINRTLLELELTGKIIYQNGTRIARID